MKKLLAVLLMAALLVCAVPFSAYAADPANLPYITSKSVGYISYTGSDESTGSSDITAKKNWGNAKGGGVIGLVAKGGTVVVCGRGYVGANYTLPALSSPLLLTSLYAGTDYQNATTKNNPECALKMKSGATFTIQSDVIIDDIIIFQEGAEQNAFVVNSGATLVIGDGVTNMSKQDFQVKITVKPGARLIVGGGDFEIENLGGEVINDYTYEYLKVSQVAVEKDLSEFTNVPPAVGYIDYNNGNNANDGLSAAGAKKQLFEIHTNGALSVVAGGGTLVASGRMYLANDYTFPVLGSPLTITGAYGGTSYVNPEPANTPSSGVIKMASGKTLTLEGEVRLENIIFFQEGGAQNTVRVAKGAVVTIGEGVVCMTKQAFKPRILVDLGGTLILESAKHDFESIEGDGVVVMPEDSKVEVKMNIGKLVGYVNGVAKELDAAPVIKNDRTMLPIRFVADSLGATVGWDGATSTVTVTNDTTTIEIVIGAKTARVNGVDKPLDSPAYIDVTNDRTYLPVRFVSDNLGATVGWDAPTQTVTLTK